MSNGVDISFKNSSVFALLEEVPLEEAALALANTTRTGVSCMVALVVPNRLKAPLKGLLPVTRHQRLLENGGFGPETTVVNDLPCAVKSLC